MCIKVPAVGDRRDNFKEEGARVGSQEADQTPSLRSGQGPFLPLAESIRTEAQAVSCFVGLLLPLRVHTRSHPFTGNVFQPRPPPTSVASFRRWPAVRQNPPLPPSVPPGARLDYTAQRPLQGGVAL